MKFLPPVLLFICFVLFASATASRTRWGYKSGPADDPVCTKILEKLSGLWNRNNKEDSKATLGKHAYKEMKMKRNRWEEEGCDCESISAPYHKDLVFQRGKADHCKELLCKNLKDDVKCEKVHFTVAVCKVGQKDSGEHNPELSDAQYRQKCGDGHECCCPHDKRSFHKRLGNTGLKRLPKDRKGDWSEFCQYYERKGHSEGQFWHVLRKAGATCDAEMGEKLWAKLCSKTGNGKKMLSGSAASASVSKKQPRKSKLRNVKAPKQHHAAHKSDKGLKEYGAKAVYHGAKKINKWAGQVADAIGPIEIEVKRRL